MSSQLSQYDFVEPSNCFIGKSPGVITNIIQKTPHNTQIIVLHLFENYRIYNQKDLSLCEDLPIHILSKLNIIKNKLEKSNLKIINIVNQA